MISFAESDKFNEECAVFGIQGTGEAAVMTALGLHALQHRGQEASGIVSYDGEQFHHHKAAGLVGKTFGAQSKHLEKLIGHAAIGHNRYSTTGLSEIQNIQPFIAELAFGGFALAHNGNLTNAQRLRQSLVNTGSLMQSTTDTEIIIHLAARSHQQKPHLRLVDALKQVEGAYSIVCLTPEGLIGVRDPHGIRPLVLGKINNSFVLASETCGLDIINAEYIRDLEAGEMLIIKDGELTSFFPFNKTESRFCVFEYIYFARPDSTLEKRAVYDTRKKIGHELALETHVEADIVVPVPDSGVPAALGYAAAVNLPFELGIIRNHYVGRTFIQPTDNGRQSGVKLKHNANNATIRGKSVILVDDSIVRGTTSKKIVTMMRQAGAKEVHLRIASPPTKNSCFYGVDTPDKDQLIAAKMNASEIAKVVGADSLEFISTNGLYRALGFAEGRNDEAPQMCDACLTGDYPIKPKLSIEQQSCNASL